MGFFISLLTICLLNVVFTFTKTGAYTSKIKAYDYVNKRPIYKD